MDIFIVAVRVPVVVNLLGVHNGEEVRDRDVLGAAVRAVAAGCAGDEVLAVENFLHLFHCGALGLVEGLEVPHERDVVLHLFHVAHAGEHHHHAGEARDKADGVAHGAAAVQVFKHGLCVLRQVHEVAALDGLHDDDGLIEFAADLIALAALHRGIIVVDVVELDLHDLNFGILGQNALEHLGAVVERDADVANFALFFERRRRLICAALLEVVIVDKTLRVHQIEVEILDATDLELALEKRANVCLGLEIVRRQLVGQDVLLARIAACQAGLERLFALALDVAVRSVKIVEARV